MMSSGDIILSSARVPMKQLTIRNVSADLDKALRSEQRRSGGSLNRTVLDLLRKALGLVAGRPYENGLARLAGTWSAGDLKKFEAETAVFEKIDEDLWK